MTAPSPAILVIGGVTIDTLRLPGKSERFTAPGGAGLYTALAIRAAGGRVRLFAQRPVPMPEILLPYDEVLDWIGPEIPPVRLPRLDIVHFGGGRAELAGADWGAQPELDPADLPDDLAEFSIAHIAPLGPTAKQIEFAAVCRSRGVGKISAGTYGRAVFGEGEAVRELLGRVDTFFMNENEAVGLFSRPEAAAAAPGQILFVTRAERGAWAVPGDGESIHVPAVRVEEYDPTGAGDSFCGAALAVIARGGGLGEVLAAGVRLAARTIRGLGPEELILRSPP
jgi:ribokinase